MSSDKELLRLLPRVLRARDFHLYLEGGKRLTDLWRFGGRAILGHKPPKLLRELKNTAERGLFSPLPHPLQARFVKALSVFFPGRAFRLYMDEGSSRKALAEAGIDQTTIPLWRPFSEGDGLGVNTLEERPGVEPEVRQGIKPSPRIMLPVLPWPLGPAALVLEKNMDTSFPPGELIPPVLLAPAARALHDLSAALKTVTSHRDFPEYPKLRGALSGSPWRRQGIYLTVEPDTDKRAYEVLFRRFLEGGFLIPPSPGEPAILPLSMSAGEETKLAGLLSQKH